jgi:hypothetical protein
MDDNNDKAKQSKLSFIPKGWKTAYMVDKERNPDKYRDNYKNLRTPTINQEFAQLAKTLTSEIAEQVTVGDMEEAAAIVEANLVGKRQYTTGPTALAISPDAQRNLIEPEPRPYKPRGRRKQKQENQSDFHL